MDRRAFCQSVAAAVATLGTAAPSAQEAETPRQALARILGLAGEEIAWLDDLSAAQRRALLTGLSTPTVPARGTIDLLYRVIGRRERLFQYVGYRPLPNRLTACDGLIRE